MKALLRFFRRLTSPAYRRWEATLVAWRNKEAELAAQEGFRSGCMQRPEEVRCSH